MSAGAPRRGRAVSDRADRALSSMSPIPAAPSLTPPLTVAAGDLLAALQAHGQADHAARVFMLTARVCRRMGVTARPAGVIALAALFHDVGKLGIPTSVLDRPGSLSADELMILRDHTIFGEAMLDGC